MCGWFDFHCHLINFSLNQQGISFTSIDYYNLNLWRDAAKIKVKFIYTCTFNRDCGG